MVWECQVKEWAAVLGTTVVPATAAEAAASFRACSVDLGGALGRQLALRSIQRWTARLLRFGRRRGYAADSTGVPDQGGDAIIGADDDPGGGTSWDDGGGGDVAGGTGAVVATGVAAAAIGVAGRRLVT